MTELVIASGKGGTGKTSLVASLAEIIGRAVVVDCDVDAANLHLVVHHHVKETHDFSASYRARILHNRCDDCGDCYRACRFDAIEEDPMAAPGSRYRIAPFSCEGCGLCVHKCPQRAIVFESVISGQWYLSDSDYGPFVHAELGVAQSNSGRLVSLLREQARTLSKATDNDLILIDGPPGIGCPVIASLTNAAYLLIVTEPSVSAVHDMQRLVEVARHFGVPCGLCINKCDIHEGQAERIERFAIDNGFVIHGMIPFDPAFTEAQTRREPYVRLASRANVRLVEDLWRSLEIAVASTAPRSMTKVLQFKPGNP